MRTIAGRDLRVPWLGRERRTLAWTMATTENDVEARLTAQEIGPETVISRHQ